MSTTLSYDALTYIRLQSPGDYAKIMELRKLQRDLDLLRERIRNVVKRTVAMEQFNNYTNGWLETFATDVDQLGSIESLIETIASKHVDDEGTPWKDE